MTVVEVFADIVCPFTHVGLHRLVERRRQLGADFQIRVRAWPLELVNGAPFEPGPVADKVAALRASVAPELFRAFEPAHFPYTSLPALAVAATAYRKDIATGERASLLLRDALFEDGLDISCHCTLQRIAASLGLHVPLDAEQDVIDDWHDGRRRGVLGSPHFFVGGHDWFCPVLHIEHPDTGGLAVSFDVAAFDDFVQACVAGDHTAVVA